MKCEQVESSVYGESRTSSPPKRESQVWQAVNSQVPGVYRQAGMARVLHSGISREVQGGSSVNPSQA